jgi:hypothetical protein
MSNTALTLAMRNCQITSKPEVEICSAYLTARTKSDEPPFKVKSRLLQLIGADGARIHVEALGDGIIV